MWKELKTANSTPAALAGMVAATLANGVIRDTEPSWYRRLLLNAGILTAVGGVIAVVDFRNEEVNQADNEVREQLKDFVETNGIASVVATAAAFGIGYWAIERTTLTLVKATGVPYPHTVTAALGATALVGVLRS